MNKVNIDAIINREHRLDRDYVPNDLITLDENENNFHNYFYPELKPSISKVIYDDYKSLEEASIKGISYLENSKVKPKIKEMKKIKE